MTWVKLDDAMPGHPKIAAAGPQAAWLYVCALCFASQYLTDGFVPSTSVRRLADIDDPEGAAERLVAVGLFNRADGGYQIHDYLQYQPSGDKVRAERDAARERMARKRSPEVRQNFAGTSDEVRLPRPVPSRPSTQETPTSSLERARELVREPVVEPVEVPVAEPVALRPVPKPKATLTELPADWEISDALWAWAEEHGLPREHVEFENEKFVDYHRGKGTKNKDWAACWRNWLRNAPQFNRGDRRGAGSPRVEPTPIRPRGSRVVAAAESPMPDGWWPTDEQMAAVRRFGLTAEEVEIQTREFVQTARVTGQTARDWHGKWQTRLRMVAQTGVAR